MNPEPEELMQYTENSEPQNQIQSKNLDINPLIEGIIINLTLESNTEEKLEKKSKSSKPMSQISQRSLDENNANPNKKSTNSIMKQVSIHKETRSNNKTRDQVEKLRINYDES